MKANMVEFFNMSEIDANSELNKNLNEIKKYADQLLRLMDRTATRMQFEPGELNKFTALRHAILDFRSIEVNHKHDFDDTIRECMIKLEKSSELINGVRLALNNR